MDAAMKIFLVAGAAFVGIISVIRTIAILTGAIEAPVASGTWLVAIIGTLCIASIPLVLKTKSE